MRTIGLFREIYGNDYPPFADCVSKEPIQGKDKIVAYLHRGKAVAAAAGVFRDVFNGESIKGEALWQTDGQYDWRSDTAYYVDRYNLKLPDDFVTHIIS